ncbi:MAG: S-layer homology domain-containing protein [Clostridia bacterium]|nr:S-layer homology domain-containing protein [Clostridia bacterium]
MMKRICTVALAALTGLNVVAFAAPTDISITNVTAKQGRVSVNVTNTTEADIMLTLTLEKDDNTLTDAQKYYAVRQKTLKAGKTEEFGFLIPDTRDGVPGSGDYIISAQNRKQKSDRQTVTIDYADSNEITAFMQELKTAKDSVTGEEPYVKLLPILTRSDSEGVFFSVGADYDAFIGLDQTVQEQIANLVYYNAETTLVADKFAEEFLGLFSLGIYNSRDKIGGLTALNPTYNGVVADTNLLSNVTGMMADSYQTNADFIQAFKLAYGLETVNRAKMNNIAGVLRTFGTETGASGAKLAQLSNLTPGQMDIAHQYIVNTVFSNPVTTETEMDTLLQGAYEAATTPAPQGGGISGGGGGGGGGSMGSVANKAPNEGSSMSAPIGSATTDSKVEAKQIFTDLLSTHWAAISVSALKEKGVISGTDSGAFEPDRAVTREEFAKMLVVVCGFTPETTTDFVDVSDTAWYAPYIGSAVKNGIVNGMGEGRFGIGETITRQDMSVMVQRALAAKGISLDTIRAYVAFSDNEQIADYAEDAVKALFEAGVINGKGNGMFDPKGQATRAEAAKIIYEAMKGGM